MKIKVHDKFKPLFKKDTRYYLLTGGRGSSKSFSVALYLCTLTFEPNQKILFTRYTLTSAKISIIPEFIEKIELLNVGHKFKVTNDSIVNITTGSVIIFKGVKTSSGNQTAALKSLQGITTWVYDEAEEEESESNFDKIDLSIRTKGVYNKVVLILNPSTKEHWIYKKFFENRNVNEGFNGVFENTTYIHTTYLDNITNLDESFIKNVELIKERNPEKYKHMILGGWLNKAEGVIFSDWEVGAFDESLPFIWGMDFGYVTDPTTLVKVAVKDNNLYLKEYLYKQHLGTNEIIDILTNIVDPNDLIVADNAEPRLISELQLAGFNVVPCKKGKDSIKNGIARMANYHFIVEGNNYIKELNNYVWNDRKSNTPIDNHNHLIDATRYAFDDLVQDSNFIFM
tara:strand:+ start:846 stop:2039 length:1194 start_codon:yes stop_codon:yes gene_type:complete